MLTLEGIYKPLGSDGFDLAVSLAIASAISNKKVPQDLVALGKVDLLGNIEGVHGIFPRVAAARRFGARKLLLPAIHREAGDHDELPSRLLEETEVFFVSSLQQAFKIVGI